MIGVADATSTYNINVLRGKATYKGAAIGYYAMTDATGAFTASAEFTADFGDSDGATGDTLMGQISNFHDANGKAMDEMVVDLDSTALTADGSFGAGTVGMTGGHANGVVWSGSWRAQLNGAPDDKVTGLSLSATTVGTVESTIMDAEASDYPTGVVGAFDAHNATTAVTGAFGASLQSDDE